MKAVWIVFHERAFSDGEQIVVAVFDAESKANEYRDREGWSGYRLSVEKWEVQ